MKYFRTILVIVALAALGCTYAQSNNNDKTCTSQKCAAADPVMLQLDSMSGSLFTRDKLFVNDEQLQASIDLPYNMIPKYSDDEMKEKMRLIPSIIPLNYNENVKQFIDFFACKKRGLMTRCLANSQIYFPQFEAILDKKGLPLELKYLPIVESAFNPVAVSRCGATGLWQLMYGTGTQMGLDINSLVDERRDPVKATEAAADYLKKLYDMYGDWHPVLAAYNSGPGNVNKAIARAGGVKNFWAIINYLPAETRSYVPTFIAAIYVMNYYQDFKLVSAEPKRELYAVDTVLITSKVSLQHISDVLNIPVDELQFLNPSIKTGVVPFTANGFALNLPVNYFAMFEAKEDDIMNDSSQMIREVQPVAYAGGGKAKTIYVKVKKHETIYNIAAKYGVTVASIKKANRLKSTTLYTGEKLRITTHQSAPESAAYARAFSSKKIEHNPTPTTDKQPVDSSHTSLTIPDSNTTAAAKAATANDTTATVKKNNNCVYYVVQPGDTLWNIAHKYNGVTIDKLRTYNKTVLSRPIKVGEVLKIFL